MGSDRLSELLPLSGVGQHRVECCLRQPGTRRRQRHASVVECGQRDLDAGALVAAEQRILADLDTVEGELGGVAGPNPELAVDLPCAESRSVRRHEKRTY